MQDGSVTVEHRKRGPDVWSYRWREPGPEQFVVSIETETASALAAEVALFWLKPGP
jgi:hypothetical protein